MNRFPAVASSFALVSSLLLPACGGSASPSHAAPDDHTVAKSALTRDAAPSLTSDEQSAFVSGGYAFAADLHRTLAKKTATSNVASSPISVTSALSMTYAGARGVTATEMAATLHFSLGADRTAKAFDWLTLALAQRAGAAFSHAQSDAASSMSPAPNADDFHLDLVNAVWADPLVKFESPFLDTMAVDYGAGVTIADFVHQADAERLAINQWVSDQTQAKITDLLPQGSIDDSTRLVLANAIHLKLPWASALTPDASPASFQRADGSKVDATYVRSTNTFGYYEDAKVQAASIALEGGDERMILVLPKGDLAAWESSLDGTTLSTIAHGLQTQTVMFAAPKFHFTTASMSLHDALVSLGMKAAFGLGVPADFTGIGTADDVLEIGDVYHKGMIGFDEKGLEAAAATAVVMNVGTSIGPQPPPPPAFTANRPFYFAVVDGPTDAVLFSGHVVDPTL
jgi:serpin B